LKDTSKNTLWTAPKYTQYKASKVSLYGAKSTDKFTVDSAATKTREGSLYYHVTDANNSSISGWIYAGKGYDATATIQDLGGLALKASDATATENNSVTVNYVASNGNSVGKSTFVTTSNDAKKDALVNSDLNANNETLTQFINDSTNTPSGYTVSSAAADITAAAAKAVYGGTVNVNVYKAATSTIAFYLPSSNGVDAGTQLNTSDFAAGKPAISGANAKLLTNDETKTVSDGTTTITDDFFDTPVAYSKLLTATSDTTFTNTDGTAVSIAKDKTYYVTYSYNKTATAKANANVKYGSTIKVVLDQTAKVAEALPDGATGSTGSTTNY
ncbi:S-layer protein, partial [Levilactobacillus brevis]|nr:S-layer protein [Levilactobacillus brevis]